MRDEIIQKKMQKRVLKQWIQIILNRILCCEINGVFKSRRWLAAGAVLLGAVLAFGLHAGSHDEAWQTGTNNLLHSMDYAWTDIADAATNSMLLPPAYAQTPDTDAFVTTWNVTGKSFTPTYNYATVQFTIGVAPGGQVSIDWGDGGLPKTYNATGYVSNSYKNYQPDTLKNAVVTISGDLERFYFRYTNSVTTYDSPQLLLSIDQWGDIQWSSMKDMFRGAVHMRYEADDAPDLSAKPSVFSMFRHTPINADLSGWDVSEMTSLRYMFNNAYAFNGDISNWDVSKVTDMTYMFSGAHNFNADLSDWDVSKVRHMNQMFQQALSFNADISGWDVSSVEHMTAMFIGASAFNADISDWDVSSASIVYDMAYMFSGATSFNRNLGSWFITLEDKLVENRAVLVTDISSRVGFDTDIDGYDITGADGDDFTISGGQLLLNSASDYSSKSMYDITITANTTNVRNLGLSVEPSVSDRIMVTTTVTDTTNPRLSSIERFNPSSATTSSQTLVYEVTFSEAVTGVTQSDFALSSASTGAANSITSISGSGSQYFVTVSASSDGTYNLDLVSSGHGIEDAANNPLINTATTGADETYTVSTTVTDTTNPRLSSIERFNPSSATTSSQTLVYEVTFSEAVTGVTQSDFALSSASTGAANSITSISGSGSQYFVTVSASSDGTYNLDLVSSGHGIEDAANNPLINTATTGADQTYTVSTTVADTTNPRLASIERYSPASQNTDSQTLVYKATFSESVTGVDASDFVLTSGSPGGTSGVSSLSGSGGIYYVTVSSTVDGTYNLDLVSSGHGIKDAADNPLTNTSPTTGTDHTYTVSTVAIDTTNPRLASIERYSPTSRNTDSQSLVYKATFSESVTGVTASDFTLSPGSTGGGNNGNSPVTGISGSGDTYYVTVSSTVDGTYNLDLVSSGHSIADTAGNSMINTAPTGADQTYTVSITVTDTANPRLASIERYSPASQNTDSQTLVYKATFSESVTGVNTSDFVLSPDSTGGGSTTVTTTGQFTQTRSPNLTLPNLQTVSDTITVSDSETATSVTVAVNITHAYIGDLKIDLIAPDGTTNTLHNRSGGGDDDIFKTYYPSFGSIPISGVWTLRINDNYYADSGVLNSWTLTINYDTITTTTTVNPVTDISGSGDTYYVTVSSTVDGTYNLDLVSSGHNIADDAGNSMTNTAPATGTDQTYNVSITTTDTTNPTLELIERYSPSSATTSSQTLVYRVTFSEDVIGVGADDFALSPDSSGEVGTSSSTTTTGSETFTKTRSPALAIPDLTTVSDSITIPDSGAATSVSVTVNISHTYIGDLSVVLIAPDGTTKTMHNRSGGSDDDINQTYTPDFDDVLIAGTWKLQIRDNANSDFGTLNSWTLTINYGGTTTTTTITTTDPVSSISGFGSVYYATITEAQGGTYNLDLVSSGHNIADDAGNSMTNTAPTTGTDQTYTVSTVITDTANPRLASIERYSPASQNTDSQTLVYKATFSESVTGVTASDFVLSPGSTGGVNDVSPVTAISGSGDTYYVTVSSTVDGTYNLDLVSSGHSVADTAGNSMINTAPTGADQTYTVSITVTDTTNPRLASIERYSPASQNTDSQTLVYKATFSESVTGVTASDFVLSPDSTGWGSTTVTTTGQFTQTRSPNLTLPNLQTVSDTITVSDSETATSVTVAVNITHAYIGDLKIDLIAPDGTTNTLHNRSGGGDDDIFKTYYPSFGSIPISGVWTLRINDNYDADSGVLNSWTLTINYDTITTTTTTVNPVTDISGSGDTYYVTVSSTVDGTYNLDLVSSGHNIADDAGNSMTNTAPTTGTDQTYTVSTVITDTANPRLASIERYSPASQNTDSQTLVYKATFSESVTGVTASDFTLSPGSTGGGNNGNSPVTGISGSGDTYYVTVSSTVDGTYNLDLVSSGHSIADSAGNSMINTAPTGADQTYTVSITVTDTANPRLASIERYSPASQNTDSQTLVYKATFSESVTGVTASDFTLSPGSTGGGNNGNSPVTGISGSGDTYYVTVSSTVDGTYNLDLVSSGHSIADTAGNSMINTAPTGADQTYTVSITVTDTANPRLASIERYSPASQNTDSQTLVYKATFSESVTGVTASDFVLSPDSTGWGSTTVTTTGQFTQTRSPNLTLPNLQTVSDTITVSDSETATSVTVAVNITHAYISDLKVDLVAPDGTTNTLHNRSGGGDDDIFKTYYPSFGSIPISGVWTLRINDNYDADSGVLNSWTLTINYDTITTTTTVNPVTDISGSGDTYYVTVSSTVDGTYNLDLVSSGHNIADDASNPLTNTATTGADQTYTVSTTVTDTANPRLESFKRYNPASRNTDSQSLVYKATFSESVTGVTASDFVLSPGSTGGVNGVNPVSAISGSGDTYYVTVSSTVDGTYNLDLVSSGHSIADTAGNSMINTAPTGADQTYTVSITVTDTTNPRLASIERYSPASQNTDSQTLVYKATFSESVTGVTASDFVLSPDSTGWGSTTVTTTGQFTQTRSPNLTLPNLQTVSDTITVSDSETATSVTVAVNITHAYISDLKVDLVAPDGTTNTLHNRSGGGDDDIFKTYYPSFGSIPISGVWTLRINDNYDADSGVLNSWTLTINYDTITTTTTVNPVTDISGSGDTYYVTVSSTVDGTYNLDLVSSGHNIADDASNPLTNTATTGADQTYTVSTTVTDTANPRLESFKRYNPASRNTDSQSLVYKATFSESVTGVTASDFVLSPGSTGGVNGVNPVSAISGSGDTYYVTVSSTVDGTYNLDLVSSGHNIADASSNPLTNTATTGADQTYTVSITVTDTANPRLASIERYSPASQNTDSQSLVYKATFSESVTGVTASDFVLSPDSTGWGSTTVTTTGQFTQTRSPNLTLPNLQTVSDTITVSDSETATSVTVAVNITHAYISDLKVDLVAPDGTTNTLHNRSGGGDDDIFKTYYLSFGSIPISGVWTLRINDNYYADSGVLNSWTLTINYDTITTTTTVNPVTDISGSGDTYYVTVSSTVDGTYNLDLVSSGHNIADDASNPLTNTATTGADQTYTVSTTVTDTANPRLESFKRYNPASRNTDSQSLVYKATFSESVTGVTASDFVLSPGSTGGVNGVNPVSAISGSGDTYYVTVSSTVDGTYNLDLVSSGHSIADTAGNSMINTAPTGADQTYTVSITVTDTTNPRLASIERYSPASQNTDSQTLVYKATFSESVTGVTASDFVLSPDSTGWGSTTVTTTGQFTQTRSPNLTLPNLQTVSDTITVSDSETATSVTVAVNITHAYISDLKVDLVAPDGTTNTLHNRSGGGDDDIFKTYYPSFGSIPISGVWTLRINDNYDADSGVLNSWTLTINYDTITTTTTVNPVTDISGSGDTYYVTVSSTVDGTYNLDLVSSGHNIADDASNPLTNTATTGADQTYTVSTTVTDTANPRLESFKRYNPASRNTDSQSLVYKATFSESVTGVTASDFVLSPGSTGGVNGVNPVSAISGSGDTYYVTVSSTVDGTYNLDLVSSGHNIADASSNPLTNTATTGADQTYTVSITVTDTANPRLASIERYSPASQNTDSQSLVYKATFSESVTGVNTSDFVLSPDSTGGGNNGNSPVTGVSGSGSVYYVTVSAAQDGTYNLDLVLSGHGIKDTADNPLTNTVPATGTDETYTVSTTVTNTNAPTLLSIERYNSLNATTSSRTLIYEVTFSKDVTGVDKADFILSPDSTGNTGNVSDHVIHISGSGSVYNVIVVTLVDGTYNLDLISSGHGIADTDNNSLTYTAPTTGTDETYIYSTAN